jgi:hypothetical protein
MSLIDANAILRTCTSDFCRIEVTPASALAALNIILEPTQNRGLNEVNILTIHYLYFR